MSLPHPCPPQVTLERFVRGQLAPEDMEVDAAHIETCPKCLAQIQAFGDHDSVERALRAHGDGEFSPVHAHYRKIAAGLPSLDMMRASTNVDVAAPEARLTRPGPAQQPQELQRLGVYRVVRVLGAGGMGTVYEAEDESLRRRVALKVMKPAMAASPAARERFQREAQLMASLKHDHIATIFQVGEDQGIPFLAMELLQGESLEDRLARGALPLNETLRVGMQIARGLDGAHRHGLIHRDIKPANIWLELRSAPAAVEPLKAAGTIGAQPRKASEDTDVVPVEPPSVKEFRVKILDFGLARPAQEEGALTGSGVIVGTPSYMAPEQAQGDPADSLCDLYSLGCVLYRMATGRLPVTGTTVMAILSNLATTSPTPPRAHDPAIPPALEALILALLSKNPADRPPSARGVIASLQAIARDPDLPVARFAQAAPAARRQRRLWIGAALLCIVSVVLYLVRKTGPFPAERADAEALARNHGDPQVIELKVPANQSWTPTKIHLKDGMVVELTATGTIAASMEPNARPYFQGVPPEGREERVPQVPQPLLPGLCLLAKIAPAQVHYVGARLRLAIDPTREGELFLGINDDDVGDNSGAWDVRIIVHPAPAATRR